MVGWYHWLNRHEFEQAPEMVKDREVWHAVVHGVAKSRAWLSDWILTVTFQLVQTVKNLPAIQETLVWSLSLEDLLEKGRATYSNILTWRIPWIEESGLLQPIGSQRVQRDWVTNTHTPELMAFRKISSKYNFIKLCQRYFPIHLGKDIFHPFNFHEYVVGLSQV